AVAVVVDAVADLGGRGRRRGVALRLLAVLRAVPDALGLARAGADEADRAVALEVVVDDAVAVVVGPVAELVLRHDLAGALAPLGVVAAAVGALLAHAAACGPRRAGVAGLLGPRLTGGLGTARLVELLEELLLLDVGVRVGAGPERAADEEAHQARRQAEVEAATCARFGSGLRRGSHGREHTPPGYTPRTSCPCSAKRTSRSASGSWSWGSCGPR